MIVLFKVTWHDSDHGNRQEWFTTQIKACKLRAKLEEASELTEVHIPKTKLGLCDWLNTHFSTDNG